MSDVRSVVKTFILREFLPGENPDELTDLTPLITGGILDSIAMLKLVAFVEDEFHIEFQAHETGIDYMNTIADITALVESKRKGQT